MILTNFAASRFRRLFEISLWLLLIACVIVGFSLGGRSGDTAGSIIGAVLGAALGLLLIILIGGFIANFLNLVDNVDKISKQ